MATSIIVPWLLGLTLAAPIHVYGLTTVVYGSQSRELLLLASKLAAREQIDTFTICAPGTENGCRRLMYGVEYADKGVDDPGKARPVSDGSEILCGLQQASCLTLIGYDDAVETSSLNTLLASCGPNLSRIVLVSRMGVTKAKASFLGVSKDFKLLESENAIRDVCAEKQLQLSIVRAGALKGGGPGETGNDLGLSKSYYNSLIDSVEASVTMAHDKYTLGVECVRGDPFELPNMFALMGQKSSFAPSQYETNRIVAASAAVAAILADTSHEISVSSAKGTQLSTMAEWMSILQSL